MHSCQLETAGLPQILACRPSESMKAIRARRSLDPASVENRVQHFPSEIIGVMRPGILSRAAKNKIAGSNVCRTLKVVRKHALQTPRHMPDVFLAGLRGFLQPAP